MLNCSASFRSTILICAALASALVLTSCARGGEDVASDRIALELWKQQAGDAEEAANKALFERFNESQSVYRIDAQSIPQAAYSDAITVAALSGNMPCVMTVDQPKVPSFAWAGFLDPIGDRLAPQTTEGLGENAKGVFQGELYSVGQFDAALALYSTRSALAKINARIPTLDEPWSKAEFDKVLAELKATGDYPYPLDIGARETNPDWWAYALSPWLQSFGGDLIDRSDYMTAEGTLNGEASVRFARWFENLFEAGYVNPKEPDDRAFHKGRVAISYTGNWWAPAYREIYGDDLLILPPPDFGQGTVIGGGSWQWGVSASCEHTDGAIAFIDFLMKPEEIAAMATAAGMIPVTDQAAALTSEFSQGGQSRVFFDLMQRYAKARPASPAFVTIANSFTRALRDIMYGGDVLDALDDAVDDIETRIKDDGGYQSDGGRP